MRELAELRANLPPYILALPDEENVLDLHFIFAYMPVLDRHPKAEPYAHGVYWFTMTFPRDYPHRAPKVVSHTTNGRFIPGMSICVAETMFQQSTMNTALSIATILTSFSLFMQDDTQPGHVGWVRLVGPEAAESPALLEGVERGGERVHGVVQGLGA